MRNPRKPFIIAEAGVNHNGDIQRAVAMADAAAEAGADAVKFQTFKAEKLATGAAGKVHYQKKTTDPRETQLTMLKRLELSENGHLAVLERCRRRGLLFLSTPFDEGSADFLDRLGMRMFKIPSGEATNLPFLRHVARKRKPVLLSTGMSTMREVAQAVAALRSAGAPRITLLHCVSSYPTPPEEANLLALPALKMRFRLPVGYSDHTEGIAIAIAAAALGAEVIEKHFTLNKNLPGPDHRMSLDPGELKTMIRGAREAAAALGDGIKAPRPCELEARFLVRKSLVLAADAPKGTRLTAKLLAAKRPGTGIPPSRLREVLGKRLGRDTRADTTLRWAMLR